MFHTFVELTFMSCRQRLVVNWYFCPPAYTGRDLIIPTVCLYMCPKHFLWTITHLTVWLWPSIMVSTVSWDDEVAHKTCCVDLHLFLTFLQGYENLILAHCTMNGGHFVGPMTHWTAWLWPSIMVSTVSWDDDVVHKTCCFDLDFHKKT